MQYRVIRNTRSQMNGRFSRDGERRFRSEAEAVSYAAQRADELSRNYMGRSYLAVYAGREHIATYSIQDGGVKITRQD